MGGVKLLRGGSIVFVRESYIMDLGHQRMSANTAVYG